MVAARSQPSSSCILFQAGPVSVDLSSAHRTAEHEHHVAVTVVGTVVAVLLRGAAGTPTWSPVRCPPCGRPYRCRMPLRAAELARHVVQLAGLVRVMVPAADFGEGGFHARVGLDQPRDLLQAAAQFSALSILRATGWMCTACGSATGSCAWRRRRPYWRRPVAGRTSWRVHALQNGRGVLVRETAAGPERRWQSGRRAACAAGWRSWRWRAAGKCPGPQEAARDSTIRRVFNPGVPDSM